VASADDEMAIRLAGEIASNATRRLGHQLIIAQELLNGATPQSLSDQYKLARAHVMGTVMAEEETLESVMQLATDRGKVGSYVEEMKRSVEAVSEAHLAALETHMEAAASRLATRPVELRQTDLERRAARIVPRQTALVKQDGYRGWQGYLQNVPAEVRSQYPYQGVNTSEVQLLIDGNHTVLDIKTMVDAQSDSLADLQGILNYLEVLKAAGLVEM
jgi:hypothetical protein